MGWLQRWDERNQSTSDWLRDRPEAGAQSLPYAKSQGARIVLGAVIGATVVGWLLFDWWVLPVGAVVLIIASRYLEHRPGPDRYGRQPPVDRT